ncbi:Ser-Thr-rich glycosyl-phosphatidyl-inositol-anchored membrane family-domain-containing protein [Apodospora peruviana]|uniref:Ser-Thr-rich glycosyl-phosphatidyl-inositol-anchored membrane family-domain-containing protein n=1 Tax=Apodospora peruviana TaxID=516989 RepID=A0AAE0MFQ0_9PEZI|nr:Ser-Thr-rich glycosyl-phosphatidyl-inositol-anchored membrane family-domain-containing protein [Apodospora peruviana]
MRFTIASLLTLASCVVAQLDPTDGFDPISVPTKDLVIPAGTKMLISWQPAPAKYADSKVSISLLGGATPGTLNVLETVATGIDNSKGNYPWSIGKDLGSLATYGLKISLDEDPTIFQYSFPFKITAGAVVSGSSSSSSAASSTSSSHHSMSSMYTSVVSSSSPIISPSASSNLSTTSTTVVSTTTSATGTPSSTTSSIPTNAAVAFAANGLAVVGGFAMAVLAL